MRRKWKKRGFIFFAALMAGLLMSHGLVELATDLSAISVAADGENVVRLGSTSAECNESNLVYVDIIAKGAPGSTITATYRTSSATAIENVDYTGVYNTIPLKLDSAGNATYRVAIKCLNDANSRQKFRLYDSNNNYGRYFNLKLLEASNAILGNEKTCRCYLSYNYKVEATVGISDTVNMREVAYIKEYKDMLSEYHKGDNDISGKETWKTWKEGVRFNADTTKRWVNTFITPGFATAYGSYVLRNIDDDHAHSESNIHMLSGNKEFMDKYERNKNCPGLSLYYEIEPCTSGGHEINGNAMYYISRNENPWKKQGALVDLEELNYCGPHKQIYWIQEKKAWYSNADSLYYSIFYETKPYQGVLDYGLAIYNSNKSWDREVHDIWLFLRLVDDKAPTIVDQYSEYNRDSGTVRVYLRFNEPVYASKKGDLVVKINNYSTTYPATYVCGNYSDTLVYEIPADKAPNVRITSLSYELPNSDIGDLSYNMDAYKCVKNNLVQNTDQTRTTKITSGQIDLAKPQLAVDLASSTKPRNLYNIMISANGNGATTFDTGTVYYTFDKNEFISAPTNPGSYANTHRLTSEEHGSFPVALAQSESLGIDSGDYYLHALAVSEYGITAHNTYGPYRLDGDPIEATQLSPGSDQLQTKTLRMRLKDKPLGTEVDSMSLAIKYENELGKEQVDKLTLVSGGEVVSSLTTLVTLSHDDEGTLLEYKSNIDDTVEIPLDNFVLDRMGSRPRLEAEFYFVLSDIAGNSVTTNSIRTVYDRRTLFENVVTVPTSYAEDTSIQLASGAKVYDIHDAASWEGIRFEITDPGIRALIDDGADYVVEVNGTPYPADGYTVVLKGLPSGYYDAVGHVSGQAGTVSVDLISTAFPFYLTDAFKDKTINRVNANGNLVLTNRTFQLQDAEFSYFKSSNNSVASHLYGATWNPASEKYEGGASSPTFSSSVEAKKYVKFMEYQDLELTAINAQVATLLNGDSTTYVKAPKETKNAQEGQLWIRYKKSTWTPSSGPSGWAFYYYGEGEVADGINITGLSLNLTSAIESVTNRIIDSGIEVNLVGEEYTHSRTGAPYLADSQMHVSAETYDQTKSGNTFVVNPTYAGDSGLFKNNVTLADASYPLATNLALEIGATTSLYFRHLGSETWNPIEAKDGTLLKDALSAQASGIYTIREYGKEGVSEFNVYLDKSLPLLKVTLNKDIASAESTIVLDGQITNLTAKNVALEGFTEEADPEAYVAVYSYPNKSLIKVLYGDDIKGYSLANGNFFLIVGDRSGNMATYTIRTAESPIELTVMENESKTGVVVRTDNRDEIEIYSFEVYLNETLIDNEFAPSKFYRGSGIYRIEVTDIYGNSEIRTIVHESPSPSLTWYYLNDGGSYSAYDPNRPSKMVLVDDPDSSRVTNVYASTTLRILFNEAAESDEVQFELLDIPTEDYTYNDSTGLLSVNTLSNWRLRVWYKSQPESDHTYVFTVDNTPPEVSTSYLGNAYYPYVVEDAGGDVVITSTFDNLDLSDYEEGDPLSLDTLRYVAEDEQTNLSFGNGAVISGSHIVLKIGDSSGLRSVTVTRNGLPMEMELSDDGELVFNGYGTYVVTIVDNLGNTTVFTFANVPHEMSTATVDGQIIGQDNLVYGADSLQIATEFDGTNTVLVQTADASYTYEFHYEDGVLTYGQYFVKTEDGEEGIEKFAEYTRNPSFVLDASGVDVRRGAWYTAVEEEGFAIYALIDESGHVQYKVVTLGPEIAVESLYSVGPGHLPNRYVATLSKEAPVLVFLTDGEEVQQVGSFDFIYVTNDLTIDKTRLSPNIVKIEYAYSENGTFGEMAVLYEDGKWVKEFVGSEYGFYKIVATNKFGTSTTYAIDKIEAYGSIVNVYRLDGTSLTYYDNEGAICANYAIELIIASTEVRFEVNGVIVSGSQIEGVTTLYLDSDGIYSVRVLGDNGIHEDFQFEIRSDLTFLYDESWITGYNEDALLREQGYTNTLCSIAPGKDVVYVEMTIEDGRTFVLYDNISSSKKLDPALLKEAIGRYGIGKYTVGFRNKYGDLVTKTVHYNNVPSIVLSRAIASDPVSYVVYDLDLAVEKGFYSNLLLSFATDSETYVFTVNGVEYRLDEPKTIEFSNLSGKGSFSYRVTFRDEYGNYVEFDAILFREDVEFDASEMRTITVNGVTYTKDDVRITFEEGLKATLSIDGGEEKDYLSGETHYADGEYRFVVRDIAGNNVTYVIVHKSANHFTLTNSSSGEEIVDGGVVNHANVVFTSTDGSKIKYVVRNGELVTDFNSTTFTLTGHYEIIVEDAIGNQSYKEFTIINNDLATFTYTAPFEFEISEVWRIDSDGTRELLNLRGTTVTLNINGDYIVVVRSTKTASSFNFSVTIDNTPPTATLVGVSEGEVTGRDVTLSGLRVGDVVRIYRDGELVSTVTITLSTDAPTISTGGRYRVTVTNLQGVTIEFNFTRKVVSNVAGSIFLIVSSALVAVGLGIGLVYHTKLKTDD